MTVRRLVVIGLALMALSGCAIYQARLACRDEAGPEPGDGLQYFGLIGGIARVSMPEWQAWSGRIGACVDQRMAELR